MLAPTTATHATVSVVIRIIPSESTRNSPAAPKPKLAASASGLKLSTNNVTAQAPQPAAGKTQPETAAKAKQAQMEKVRATMRLAYVPVHAADGACCAGSRYSS